MPRWFSVLLTLALLLPTLLAVDAPARARDATPVPDSVHGVDPADMDLAVNPAVDFNRFANGGWLDANTIPADRGSFDNFTELSNLTKRQLLGLLANEAANPDVDLTSDPGKAVTFFAQGMDVAKRNAEGVAPIQPLLDEIAAIDSRDAMNVYLESAIFKGVGGFAPLGVGPDLGDSSMNVVYVGGPSLGLPNRDYYLDDKIGTPEVRQSYLDATAKLLGYGGYSAEDATKTAQAVYDLEKKLAEPTLTREEQQDPYLSYNPLPVDEVAGLYPEMDWNAYLNALGLEGTKTLIVAEKDYLAALPQILAETDLPTLKAFLELEILWGFSNNLAEDMEKVVFDYAGKTLGGLEQQSPLDERVLGQVNGTMGDPIGQLYVAEYFPPAAKAEMERLTADIIAAFRDRLEANAWLSPETRAVALDKLSTLRVKVGYPDKWDDYANLDVADTYAQTALNASNVNLRRQLAKAGKPVDRDEWGMPPQTVNAFYNPLNNEIVFPAGILQAPFFDVEADAPSNYGAIGMVIGHEITHGFDLQGSRFDARGNLADWWTPGDTERFQALNDELAAQYSKIEVAPGLFINGQLTVTENTADLGGLQVAYGALQRRLQSDPAAATPVAELAGATPETMTASAATPVGVAGLEPPFTPEQRFFIAAATNWRELVRPASLETQVNTDSHAPAATRAVEPLRNADAFYDAFDIQPGDPMYLAPEDRVVIW